MGGNKRKQRVYKEMRCFEYACCSVCDNLFTRAPSEYIIDCSIPDFDL